LNGAVQKPTWQESLIAGASALEARAGGLEAS
jgi:hypothetical protein